MNIVQGAIGIGSSDPNECNASISTENPESSNSDNSLEILKLLLDEWKFRLAQVWSLMTKFYLLNMIVMVVPVMREAWGVDVGPLGNHLWILPFISLVFSGLVGYFSYVEMGKINDIKTCLRENIQKNYPQFCAAFTPRNKGHQSLPIIIFGVQGLFAFAIALFFLIVAFSP